MEYIRLFTKLEKLLKQDERLVVEGALDKNKTAEEARKYSPELLNLLQKDADIKNHFFVATDGGLIFKKDLFLQFIGNKEFLPSSYTAYKNKIGLATGRDEFLSEKKEVVLNWPYKDCVLEGGQDKEDQKRQEVFFNEVLAPDQISRLLDDKVFTDWKRYDKDGEHELDELKDNDNLIIKGNNLVVLHSLKKRFAGKVKLIYIDPPYNTGNDSFGYNDKFNHSTWLTFMKNRLEVARELLSSDGSIYIQLDFNEVHYAKVLMDEVFGRENFQREIIWSNETSSGFKAQANNWVRGHDTILYYTKSQDFYFSKLYYPLDEKTIKRYDKTDENGEKYKQYFEDGKERRVYLKNSKGKPLSDVWTDIIGFQTSNRGGETLGFEGQKTEKLVERIINSSTEENDIVLDYHLGSGTTAAVAHKMGRQYIGIEQLNYGDNDATVRLQNVINGDQTGISKSVDWQGGGSFVYAHIQNDANKFRERVQKAKAGDLEELFEEVKQSSFLSYRVEPKKMQFEQFAKLSLAEQKRLLLELVDSNTLYVNYSDIDDATHKVDVATKKHNHKFYGKA